MATIETSAMTLRTEPKLKEALCTGEEREHRSLASMMAMLSMDNCKRNDIPIELDQASGRKKTAK